MTSLSPHNEAFNNSHGPLYGLILAGGRSQRMGQDKGLLTYNGIRQIDHCSNLLNRFCKKTFLSIREQQYSTELAPELPRIHDRYTDCGPLSGILSAQESYPHASWLVLACDLPLLGIETLQQLITQRNPVLMASVFCRDGDFLEPLCAIYEPRIRPELTKALVNKKHCPRAILANLDIQKIDLENARALTNVNDFREYSIICPSP